MKVENKYFVKDGKLKHSSYIAALKNHLESDLLPTNTEGADIINKKEWWFAVFDKFESFDPSKALTPCLLIAGSKIRLQQWLLKAAENNWVYDGYAAGKIKVKYGADKSQLQFGTVQAVMSGKGANKVLLTQSGPKSRLEQKILKKYVPSLTLKVVDGDTDKAFTLEAPSSPVSTESESVEATALPEVPKGALTQSTFKNFAAVFSKIMEVVEEKSLDEDPEIAQQIDNWNKARNPIQKRNALITLRSLVSKASVSSPTESPVEEVSEPLVEVEEDPRVAKAILANQILNAERRLDGTPDTEPDKQLELIEELEEMVSTYKSTYLSD